MDSPALRALPAFALTAVLFAVVDSRAEQDAPASGWRSPSFAEVIQQVLPRVVKIYGAGGLQGFEAYQSGFLISPEGHVLTVWSYVLDTDQIGVTLHDGRKLAAVLVGADPQSEIAIIKITVDDDLPYFDWRQPTPLEAGDRVLAFSNLFGVATGNEPVSVQHGSVSVRSTLSARRGAFESNYRGPVYVMDAMTNNPGAAGGALTDQQGRLAGMLGRELINSLNNTWLNYSVPIDALQQSIEDVLQGTVKPRSQSEQAQKPAEPHALKDLGLVMVPDVLAKTPPFIERLQGDSLAEKAGLRSDDLILFVNGRLVASIAALLEELSFIDQIDPLVLTIQRDSDLLEVEIRP